jgi:uncharacterized short protein YbdD (DUF466 family)
MATYTININERTTEGKNILEFLQKSSKYVQFKKKEKVKDPTEMTKEEFYAQIERAYAQYERGEYTEVKPEDISKYLGLE